MPTSIQIKNLTVSDDAIAAINAFMLSQKTGVFSTLNGAVLANATTLTLQDGTSINNNDAVLIDGEAYLVTAKASKTYTVTPAYLGTTSTIHTDKAVVQQLKYATYALLFQANVTAVVAQIMATNPFPTSVTQNAIITSAQSVIATAVANAVL